LKPNELEDYAEVRVKLEKIKEIVEEEEEEVKICIYIYVNVYIYA
jgi:hypothetical protein